MARIPKKLITILLAVYLVDMAYGGLIKSNRHPEHAADGRIINGYPASPHSVPHIVAITALDANNNKTEYCGGCLLSDRHVLTAAHCLHDNKKIILLKFGAHNRFSDEPNQVIRNEASYVIHEGYSKFIASHDIALITFETPVDISLPHVRPAKLPSKEDINETYVGKIAQAFGWGYTSTLPKKLPDQLMGANATVLDNEVCKQRLRNSVLPYFYDYEICTEYRYANRPRGVCHGDSGGPLMYDGKLIAITSRGTEWNCENNKISIFVNVAKHLDWIEEKMKST